MSNEELSNARIAEEVLKCKLNTWNKIEDILEHIGVESIRVDELEATMVDIKKSLTKHELQRQSFNDEIKEEMKALRQSLDGRSNENRAKYSEILVALESLTIAVTNVKNETDDNSKSLMQKRIKEEQDRAVQAALEKHDEPYKEYKKKAILVVVTIVTGAVVTGAWKLIMFVANLDEFIGISQ